MRVIARGGGVVGPVTIGASLVAFGLGFAAVDLLRRGALRRWRYACLQGLPVTDRMNPGYGSDESADLATGSAGS
jgi:hypothetical protein